MDCIYLHLKMEFRSYARGQQWGIFHYRLMKGFIKTEAAILLMQTVFPEGFPFLGWSYQI